MRFDERFMAALRLLCEIAREHDATGSVSNDTIVRVKGWLLAKVGESWEEDAHVN